MQTRDVAAHLKSLSPLATLAGGRTVVYAAGEAAAAAAAAAASAAASAFANASGDAATSAAATTASATAFAVANASEHAAVYDAALVASAAASAAASASLFAVKEQVTRTGIHATRGEYISIHISIIVIACALSWHVLMCMCMYSC